MIRIQNKADEKPTVEILGDIGEDFWTGGGVTAQNINDQIKAIEGDFDLLVGSLGGDVDHALMIHDLIRMHPGKVNTKIIGMTASSGTIIAMAGDSIEMSKNAMFLIHNAWTMAAGNSKDLQKTAKDLDVVDGRIAGIYSRVTGKRKSQMLSLMEKEEWLTADQAKEYGFVSKIFEPATPTMNKSIIEKINNSELPKIKNMDTSIIMNMLTEIKNLVIGKPKEEIETTDYQAKVSELETHFENLKTENETLLNLKTEFENKIAGFEAEKETLKAEKDSLIVDKANAIAEKESAIIERDTLKNEYIEYAKAKLDRVTCEKLGVDDFSFMDVPATPGTERAKMILAKKKLPSIKDVDDN